MIRIKKDADIEELKKYGLYPVYQCNTSTGETRIIGFDTHHFSFKHLFFKKKKRVVNLRYVGTYELFFKEEKEVINLDVLYDLIKADLVEKGGNYD